jgi:hypothetical protein
MFNDEGGVGTVSSSVRRARSKRGTLTAAALAAFGTLVLRPCAAFFTGFLADLWGIGRRLRAAVAFGRLTDRLAIAFLTVRRAGWRFLLAFRVGRALRLAIG